jgi:hypothetical protein
MSMMKNAADIARAAAKGAKAGYDATHPNAAPAPRSAFEAGQRSAKEGDGLGTRMLKGAGAGMLHAILRALGVR